MRDKKEYSQEQSEKMKQQELPGLESKMEPRPLSENPEIKGSDLLKNKIALITGGDSGIGRAVAIAFAREGASCSIVYYNEHEDAKETKKLVEEKGQKCLLLPGDVKDENFCREAVERTVKELGQLNIVVNNAAEQYAVSDISEISSEQLIDTFATNFFGYFYITKAALPHLHEGDSIINTTSVVAYKGSPELLDYSATKGAIVTFTRSLALAVIEKGIRVNGVAPGPIWTPLIPSSFSKEKIKHFGQNVPMKRAGQPEEVAPCYVFLASENASYMSGQILHPNGGVIVNG